MIPRGPITFWCAAVVLCLAGCAALSGSTRNGSNGGRCDAFAAGAADPRGDKLLATGEASLSGEQPEALARQRALQALAEQIEVRVRSESTSGESLQRRHDQTEESEHYTSTSHVDSALMLQGAEVVGRCQDERNVHVVLGIERLQAADQAQEEIDRLVGSLRELQLQAARTEQEGDLWAAATSWWGAAQRVTRLEELALLVRVVGRRQVQGSWPQAAELQRRARDAAARAAVVLTVEPAEESTAGLRQQAASCLSALGLAVVGPGQRSDVEIHLEVVIPAVTDTGDGLFVARGSLAASLRRKDTGAAATAAAQGEAKGAGGNAEAARRDAVRMLARLQLSPVLAGMLGQAGWPVSAQCGERL